MEDIKPTVLLTDSQGDQFSLSTVDSEFSSRLSLKVRQDSYLENNDTKNSCTDFLYDPGSILNDETFFDELAPGMGAEQEAEIIAKRMFLDDKELFRKEEVAQFLGKRGELNILTLEKYLNHFDFAEMRLEEAFRHFCTKLFLKGESQTIDKILNQFARRYWECNQHGIFPNRDTVYTIVYSLLLLNTDLHVAHVSHKISKQDFVKNTLASIQACTLTHSILSDSDVDRISVGSFSGEELTRLLKEMYSSVKHIQIPQPFQRKSRRRSSSMGMIGSLGLTRSQSVHTLRKVKSKLTSKPSTSSFYQYDSRSSFHPEGKNRKPAQPIAFGRKSMMSECDAYSKSAILIRKHLYERTGKKAQNRQWKSCFVALDRGDLKMFKTGKGHLEGDGSELMDIAMQMGHISLRHSLTTALPPPGYSNSRPHVFAVQLPNGGVYLFQTASCDHVQEWVNVCNYWAARESKEPMPGGVCNVDYGWKRYFESKSKLSIDHRLPVGYDDRASIKDWVQPNNPMIRSSLSEQAQLRSLIQYNVFLEKELTGHMELRGMIFQRFSPKSSNMTRAFSNWERKSQYLLRELIKYQTYADSLKQILPTFTCQPTMDLLTSSPLQRLPEQFLDYPVSDVTLSNTSRCDEEITAKIQVKDSLCETEFPEVDDESVYELCREHLSSTESD